MSKLASEAPLNVSSGTYNLKVVPNAGTAKLQFSVQNEAMQDIPDATTSGTVLLPSCKVQSVITGDAELYLNKIDH